MDVVKAAVRHDQDDVRGLRVATEMGHNLLRSRVKPGANPLLPQHLNERLGLEARLCG